MARDRFLDIYFCQKQPRNSHFFPRIRLGPSDRRNNKIFYRISNIPQALNKQFAAKIMVLLEWYKELFKRVESTQKYIIEINNKSIYKVKLNLYSLGKIFILANDR